MMHNKTAEFLGAEYTWSRAQIELRDVQALWGGVRVLLPSWSISQMFVSRYAPDGRETKFKLPVDWDTKKELCRLCVEQDFLTIAPEQRAGVADEARPAVTLTNARRESHTVTKWTGVQDARFDAVYGALLSLAARAEGQRPMARRFSLWQKGLFFAGLFLGLVLLLALAYLPAQQLVEVWWPQRIDLLAVLLVTLVVLHFGVLAWVGRRERRKMRWDRPVTNPIMVITLNFLIFLGLIGLLGMAEAIVSAWRNGASPAAGDERALYVTLSYSSILGAWFLVLTARLIGASLLRLVDERF